MQNVVDLNAKDFYNAINLNKVILIDVRTIQEYSNNKIEGSINIPLDDLEKDISKYAKNKNESVYVYCLSGSRSTLATEMLSNLRYTKIFNLSHGLLSWRISNLPLVK